MPGRSVIVSRRTAGVLLGFSTVLLPPVLLLVVGCRTAPMTERRQLLITTEDRENSLGTDAYRTILQQESLSGNARYVEMVQRVGRRIAAVADRPDFSWEFNLIESDVQNAFCLPGGKVAVYTGMLPACESEAGLAVVMSHEVAHAIARHGGERMSHHAVQNLGRSAVGFVMQNQEEQRQKMILTAYGAVSEYGAILPYSRQHELEADQIGIMLMARAGYDPSEAPVFWERFAAAKGTSAPLEFLSTHPSDARRSSALREQLPEALRLYNQSGEKFGLGDPIQ